MNSAKTQLDETNSRLTSLPINVKTKILNQMHVRNALKITELVSKQVRNASKNSDVYRKLEIIREFLNMLDAWFSTVVESTKLAKTSMLKTYTDMTSKLLEFITANNISPDYAMEEIIYTCLHNPDRTETILRKNTSETQLSELIHTISSWDNYDGTNMFQYIFDLANEIDIRNDKTIRWGDVQSLSQKGMIVGYLLNKLLNNYFAYESEEQQKNVINQIKRITDWKKYKYIKTGIRNLRTTTPKTLFYASVYYQTRLTLEVNNSNVKNVSLPSKAPTSIERAFNNVQPQRALRTKRNIAPEDFF